MKQTQFQPRTGRLSYLSGSGRIFSGSRISPKYGTGLGKMQAILTGNGILQLPRKQDLLKFKHGMWDFWSVCWESVKPYQTIEYALLISSVPCNFFLVKQKRNSGKLWKDRGMPDFCGKGAGMQDQDSEWRANWNRREHCVHTLLLMDEANVATENNNCYCSCMEKKFGRFFLCFPQDQECLQGGGYSTNFWIFLARCFRLLSEFYLLFLSHHIPRGKMQIEITG